MIIDQWGPMNKMILLIEDPGGGLLVPLNPVLMIHRERGMHLRLPPGKIASVVIYLIPCQIA